MSVKELKRKGLNFLKWTLLPDIDAASIQNKITGDPRSLKLVGFVKCFNEEKNGNIEKCLKHLSCFCDDIVICDDSSTDNSVEIAKKFTNHIIQLPDDYNAELEHKETLLQKALTLNPDWIVWLDPDETFDRDGESGGIRNLCQFGTENNIDHFSFHYYNQWGKPDTYRIDGPWFKNWQPKLWKNTGNLKFDIKRGLHFAQHPLGLKHERRTTIKLIHYGFTNSEIINKKYNNFISHGMTKQELEVMEEKGLNTKKFQREWFPSSMTNHK